MVTINVDLPADLRALAEARAKLQGMSLADFVRTCVNERIESLLDQELDGPERDELLEADEAHLQYMRDGLREAEEAVARGEVKPWDKAAFLRDMRQRASEQ